MKTIEEKAKAYDEALERANQIVAQGGTSRYLVTQIFSELKESEDERIRKWLYDYISHCPNDNFAFYGGVGKDAVLDYLEKQKEQKPAEWSEEEEQMFGNILNHYSLIEAPTDGNGISKERYLAFIKSLRPQPKQERDEEDERVRKWLLEYFYLHRDDLRGASVTSMEILSFLDNHPGKGGACDVDDFSLTLRNCLYTYSRLTAEQADAFARAYGEDLYNVAIGEISTGFEKEDIEEYRNGLKQVEQWSNPSKCKHDLQDLTC